MFCVCLLTLLLFPGAGGAVIKRGGAHSQLISAAAPYTQSPFSAQCVNINNVNTGMFGLSVSAAGGEVILFLIF